MTSSRSPTATLTVTGPLRRADLPALLERTDALLEAGGVRTLYCEMVGVAADAVALDALARVALAARRSGCGLQLRGASQELHALVAFTGLAGVLCG